MRLPALLLVMASAACDGNSSTSPSGVQSGSLTSGAVITGRVSGIALNASTLDRTASTTGATTLRVSIAGTNISTMVDGAGQFTLSDVPSGTVTLTFTGQNVSASITVNNVSVGDEIRIDVRLNGSVARIESEDRRRGHDNDHRDEVNEVKGMVSALNGSCPGLTFTVGTRVVRTGSGTIFDDRCTDIRNGVRVEISGTRANDGTFTAARVEVDH
jgi:hypothetical protein